MPNWCYTNIKMSGSNESVLFLFDKIREWTRGDYMNNGFGHNWLGNIVLGSGIAAKEDMENGNVPRCRGTLTYMDIDTRPNENKVIEIDTETAWGPMLQMWLMINEHYKLDLDITYYSEEPGCEVFITNDRDIEGLYNIDSWDVDEVESLDFVSEKYVIHELQRLLKTEENDVTKLISMLDESEFNDKMAIYQYEYVSIEDLE